VPGAAGGVLDAGWGADAQTVQAVVTPEELEVVVLEFDRPKGLADEVDERMGDVLSQRRIQVAEGQV
jgi:hypothetical protein